jgi:hypothetical protein
VEFSGNPELFRVFPRSEAPIFWAFSGSELSFPARIALQCLSQQILPIASQTESVPPFLRTTPLLIDQPARRIYACNTFIEEFF